MKRTVIGIGTVVFFLCMLITPKSVFNGASKGLLLWFQIVLPTLFPFLVLTNFLLVTGNISYISSAVGGVISRLFKVSSNGSFAVLVGFLCGYPMGAKTAADLTVSGMITPEEGRYLLSFCNNTSPVFILNYLVWKTLGQNALLIPSLLILLVSPMLVSLISRRKYLCGNHCFYNVSCSREKKTALSMLLVDQCIMDSFETLVKVGGYIILFSVLLTMCLELPIASVIFTEMLSLLEVTTGISILGKLSLPFIVQYPLLLGLTAFGGFCAIAQTQCMVQKPAFRFCLT